MKVSYNWLQSFFEKKLPPVEELVSILTYKAFEVEGFETYKNDTVISVDILPNRSSDCLSHRGIAREIATLTETPLREDPLRNTRQSFPPSKILNVEIKDKELCNRFTGAVILNVKVGPSPDWLKNYLETIGQKSINNIVDITNYVMFHSGQPLHAFDLNKIKNANKNVNITVRKAHDGETIETLDGGVYTLTGDMLVIASDNAPLAIAGIKGGKDAQIDEQTTDIVLEAAHFNFVNIRKTSRALKLQTDASIRFQNEPSRELTYYALQEALKLFQSIAQGSIEGVVDQYPNPYIATTTVVTLSQINSRLGSNLTTQTVQKIFDAFNFEYKNEGESFAVVSPFERTDLHNKEDLIEEVGRVYGYEKIDGNFTQEFKDSYSTPKPHKAFYYSEKIRSLLVRWGFSEIFTYSFQENGEVEVVNPRAHDKPYLRNTLHAGMIASLELNKKNAPLFNLEIIQLFEFGAVFSKQEEHTALGIGITGKGETIENIVNKLSNELGVPIHGNLKNNFYEINFDELIKHLPEVEAYEPFEKSKSLLYKPFSPYPFIARDIALWIPSNVEDASYKAQNIIESNGGNLLVRVDIFDTFEKEGRISYAFRLVFQSHERTLIDEEVNIIMNTISEVIHKESEWQVR